MWPVYTNYPSEVEVTFTTSGREFVAAVEQWTTPEGAWVLLPHPDGIRQAILDLLSSSA